MPGHYNSGRRRGPAKRRTPAKPAGRMTAAKKASARSTSASSSGSMSATPRTRGQTATRAPAKPRGRVTAQSKAAARSGTAPAKRSAPAKSAKFGVGSNKTVMHKGKEMANVTAEQLKKTGMSLREYMNAWNKSGKRPVKAAAPKAKPRKLNPGAEGRAF